MLTRAFKRLFLSSQVGGKIWQSGAVHSIFQIKTVSSEIPPESLAVDSEKKLQALNKTFVTNAFALYVRDRFKKLTEQSQGICV
jgi:hypothetical protein